MKNKTSLVLFFLFFLHITFSQNTDFVEVAVEEIVDLKAKSMTIVVRVYSKEDQNNQNRYGRSNRNNYDFDGEFMHNYEERILYSPESITEPMRKKYEAIKKQIALYEAEELRREREFKPFLISDLIKLLEENYISYQVKRKLENSSSGYEEYEYQEEQDSLIFVQITSVKEYHNLVDLTASLPVLRQNGNVTYEELDQYASQLIPVLAMKARKQAELMAISLNRKLGKAISCSNVPKSGLTSKAASFYTPNENYDENLGFSSRIINPMDKTQKALVGYFYRFELVD